MTDAPRRGFRFAYRRPFRAGPHACRVVMEARMSGLHSALEVDGTIVAEDETPAFGPDAVRNHRLTARLADGSALDVEAGYISLWNVGIAARRDGSLIHESHPGRTIAFPEKQRRTVSETKARSFGEFMRQGGGAPGVDLGAYKRNRVPIAVDIALTVLFYIVAKFTDLSTAAIVGAVVGLGLIAAQRFVKVDLIGGLALFGVVMALLSAALAILFQDDMAVKMRGTILGLVSATLFLGDGLLGGKRLGKGMARYLPYTDIHPGRLAIGMGVLGLVVAGLNALVARVASTDVWLFYTTFADTALIMLLMFGVFRFARTGNAPDAGAGTAAPSP